MTNEMKLLTALCDALGFDVEMSLTNLKELDAYEVSLNKRLNAPINTVYYMELDAVKPIYEYKLTKRVVDAEMEWAKDAGILDESGKHKL